MASHTAINRITIIDHYEKENRDIRQGNKTKITAIILAFIRIHFLFLNYTPFSTKSPVVSENCILSVLSFAYFTDFVNCLRR